MAPPTLEIHVPISPTPRFFNMVRCLVVSIRRNGGRYADANVVVTIGDDELTDDLDSLLPWDGSDGVELRRTADDLYARGSYGATFAQRFRYSFEADVVLLLDADVLVTGPLDELVESVASDATFTARIGGIAPFEGAAKQWQKLYDRAGLGTADLAYQYGAWPTVAARRPRRRDRAEAGLRFGPPYCNLGVVCATGDTMNRIGELIFDHMALVRSVMKTQNWVQIAFTLAVVELGIEFQPLSYRFNFPNAAVAEDLYPAEAADIRIAHMLGQHQGVTKSNVFRDLASLEEFAARDDLVGANEAARMTISQVLDDVRGDIADEPPVASGSGRLRRGRRVG